MSTKKQVKSELLAAVEFCKLIAPSGGILSIVDGIASVVTPEMHAYHPVNDDINVTTDLDKFQAAIRTIGDRPYAMTVNKTLKMTAGRFRVELPILEFDNLYPVRAEQINVPIDPYFFQALTMASLATTPGHDRVACAGVYLSPQHTVVGTNGFILIEAYHGNASLAHGILIPTQYLFVVERALKKGYRPSRAIADNKFFAILFENGAILMTRLYMEDYVNYERIFDSVKGIETVDENVPELFSAFEEIADFGNIFDVTPEGIACGSASVQYSSRHTYSIKVDDWKKVKHIVQRFNPSPTNLVYFQGSRVRGCIAKVKGNAH